jgi:hypothetical protein
LLTLVLAVGDDLVGANALKAVAGMRFAGAALVVFAGRAEAAWFTGGLISLGGSTGAWVGATLAARERAKLWVFRVLILTMGGEMVRLVWQEGAASSARPVWSSRCERRQTCPHSIARFRTAYGRRCNATAPGPASR